MDKITCEIIMLLKGHSKIAPEGNPKKSLARYLSYLYDCPEEYYTENELWSSVRQATIDFLGSCTSPGQVRAFMYRVFENRSWYDELESYISALRNVQVRENGEYINGFSKELLREVCEPFYRDRYEVTITSDAFPDPEDAYAIWDNREEEYCADLCSEKVFTFPSEEEAKNGLEELIRKYIP